MSRSVLGGFPSGLLAALLTVTLLAACGSGRRPPAGLAGAPPTPDGGVLLQRACTGCHDLGGLKAFSEYWGEPEWRSMVETMITYGAEMTPEEISVLSRYLAVRYGTASKGE